MATGQRTLLYWHPRQGLFGSDYLQLFEQTYHVLTQHERNCGKSTKQRLVGSDRLSVPREEAPTRKEKYFMDLIIYHNIFCHVAPSNRSKLFIFIWLSGVRATVSVCAAWVAEKKVHIVGLFVCLTQSVMDPCRWV